MVSCRARLTVVCVALWKVLLEMRILRAFLLGLLFLLLGLLLPVVNLLLLLNLLLVYPFSPNRCQCFAADIITSWMVVSRWYMQHVLGFTFVYQGDSLQEVERAIFIANHQSMIDIVMFNWAAKKFKKQRNITWLAKNDFKYVPFLGWAAYLTRFSVFLHRDWQRDHSKLQKSFARLLALDRPFWLLFCPEGTRLTPKNLAESQAHSRSHDYPLLQKVLLPRPKGFIAAVQTLRGQITSVLDMTISYSHAPPLFPFIVAGAKITITLHARVIDIKELPDDEDGLRDWLQRCYLQKDKLLSSM